MLVPGLVLVRQKPGSARGVMFMTVEDETGVANLIIWPALFRRQRRLILSATMLACFGRVQKAGGVVHVIAERLTDLSDLLRGVGSGETVPPPDRREWAPRERPGIRVPTRDFR